MANQGKDKTQHGTGAEGTREREERITGSVGVQNRKGETVHQGSTTSAKGGIGRGSASQGDASGSYMGGTSSQGSERNADTTNMSKSTGAKQGGGQHEMGGQQNVGGRQQGGVQGSLQSGQPASGVPTGNLGGQQGNVKGGTTERTGSEGQGSRAGGQDEKVQNQPFVDEDQG